MGLLSGTLRAGEDAAAAVTGTAGAVAGAVAAGVIGGVTVPSAESAKPSASARDPHPPLF